MPASDLVRPLVLKLVGNLASSLTRGPGGGGDQPVDPNILFLDDFSDNPGPLIGRQAQVGGLHYASGPGAQRMVVADGVMMQTAAGVVGYDNVLLTEVPGSMSCDFIWGAGLQPPVMGIYPYSGTGDPNFFNVMKLLHLYMTPTGLYPQMGHADYFGNLNANHPAAWEGPASPFALVVGEKYSLECKIQDKWVFMELFDASGVSIAKAQSYDSLVPSLVGRAAFLAETFDNQLAYEAVRARKAVPFAVPSIAPAIDSYFPSGLDGLTDSPFVGGSVTWSGAGSVTITANATLGSGAAVPIGAIALGDRVRVCIDVTSVGANGFLTAIAPTSPGSPISDITPFFTSAGRAVVDLVATGADADSSLIIGGNGVGATTCGIKGLFILMGGPTAFV